MSVLYEVRDDKVVYWEGYDKHVGQRVFDGIMYDVATKVRDVRGLELRCVPMEEELGRDNGLNPEGYIRSRAYALPIPRYPAPDISPEDMDDEPEFPTYYDAQGREHGEF